MLVQVQQVALAVLHVAPACRRLLHRLMLLLLQRRLLLLLRARELGAQAPEQREDRVLVRRVREVRGQVLPFNKSWKRVSYTRWR